MPSKGKGRDEMMTALISAGSAIIVGILTLIGVAIQNNASEAIMRVQIEELTREVRKHNNFAEKIPLLQNDIDHIKEDMEFWKAKLP